MTALDFSLTANIASYSPVNLRNIRKDRMSRVSGGRVTFESTNVQSAVSSSIGCTYLMPYLQSSIEIVKFSYSSRTKFDLIKTDVIFS